MADIVRIALIAVASSLLVIFTCDMIFWAYYKRKLDYKIEIAKGITQGIEEILQKSKDSQEKQ